MFFLFYEVGIDGVNVNKVEIMNFVGDLLSEYYRKRVIAKK